jgi:hypothetical protein
LASTSPAAARTASSSSGGDLLEEGGRGVGQPALGGQLLHAIKRGGEHGGVLRRHDLEHRWLVDGERGDGGAASGRTQ